MQSYSNDELYHHGRKGMKWGQHLFGRVYRNKDGSLTSLGRKRANKYATKYRQLTGKKPKSYNNKPIYSSEKKQVQTKSKSISDMSDDELRNRITRIQLERKYRTLQPAQISLGKKFIDKVLLPASTDAAKTLLKEYMIKEGRKALGVNGEDNKNNKKKKEKHKS